MNISFKRPPDLFTMGKTIEREMRLAISFRLLAAFDEMHRIITESTPVYTGRTLVNFRWSADEAQTSTRGPVLAPRLPGKTSEMALGEEPRRAANQEIIDTEYRSNIRTILRSAKPYRRFFLTNNLPNFSDVEYGRYGSDARTPAAGITRAAESQLRMIVRGITKNG